MAKQAIHIHKVFIWLLKRDSKTDYSDVIVYAGIIGSSLAT